MEAKGSKKETNLDLSESGVVAGERLFVSVVMPVRNEADFIQRSLGSVLTQTYPDSLMEVIVADGKSIDATREIIRELASTSEIRIIVVDNPHAIAPTGLNRAIEQAKGDVIIRVDGHCEVHSDYVENCVSILRSGVADGVGGPIETIGDGIVSVAIALAMSSAFGVGGSAFRTINDREMYTDTVAFPGYTREIIERVGPYNEELVRNQDDEYNFRIRKHGGKILLSPGIKSTYYSRSSFRSLWLQYYQYGYWKVRVLQLHPRQMSIRHFVPLLFVISIASTAALFLIPEIGITPLAVLIGLYLFANLTACLRATGFDRATLIPLLAIGFACLHISYGLGFLVGLLSFGWKWSQAQAINIT